MLKYEQIFGLYFIMLAPHIFMERNPEFVMKKN